jgi:hypothetical protein
MLTKVYADLVAPGPVTPSNPSAPVPYTLNYIQVAFVLGSVVTALLILIYVVTKK